jgi:hypothetical protein
MSSKYETLLELIDNCKEKLSDDEYVNIMNELKKINNNDKSVYYEIIYDVIYSFPYKNKCDEKDCEDCNICNMVNQKFCIGEDNRHNCIKYLRGYDGDGDDDDFNKIIIQMWYNGIWDMNLDLGCRRITHHFCKKMHTINCGDYTAIINIKSIEKMKS